MKIQCLEIIKKNLPILFLKYLSVTYRCYIFLHLNYLIIRYVLLTFSFDMSKLRILVPPKHNFRDRKI